MPLQLILWGAVMVPLLYIAWKVFRMSAEFDRLTAAVEAETTIDDSILALLSGLAEQIRNADTPEKSAALADKVEAENARMAAALTANTPAA